MLKKVNYKKGTNNLITLWYCSEEKSTNKDIRIYSEKGKSTNLCFQRDLQTSVTSSVYYYLILVLYGIPSHLLHSIKKKRVIQDLEALI